MSEPRPTGRFPFSAVVGQDEAKLALLLAAADPAIGGVLLRGEKGSAKTTLARGLAALLPGGGPFVELPLGATEDRVVGSLDLAAALTGGEVRFQPGLLASAHGGVLYVDEVNLLADHLVDVLLDVAVSGVNRVERDGLAHTHPSRFVLVGSMNPEEGELRPQLLDRFGLAVEVAASNAPTQRAEAVRRRMAFDADPERFAGHWTAQDAAQARHLQAARPAPVPEDLVDRVSALCAAVGAEGLRADLVICRAASALAGLEGRAEATVEDVRRVAPLALAHRRRRQPFDQPGMAPDEVDDALDRSEEPGPPDEPPSPSDPQPEPEEGSAPENASPDRTARPDHPTAVPRLEAPRATGGANGRRSTVESARGRLVGDRRPEGPPTSVAVTATVRAAAARAAARAAAARAAAATATATAAAAAAGTAATTAGATARAGPLTVEAEDLREAVREERAGNLVILAVDASGSMGAQRRMEAAKGAVISLLLDAYQRRDRVAVVTFRGTEADVVLRPTGSVEVARARLADLPTGGRTPLAAGILAALDVAERSSAKANELHRPLLVLVTDGRATAAPGPHDPVAAAHQAAATVRHRGIPAVVVDAEDGPARLGLAAELAAAMGARYVPLAELSAGALDVAIRGSVSGGQG